MILLRLSIMALVFLTGCSNFQLKDGWKQELLGAASVKLLYEEFEVAKSAVLSNDYGEKGNEVMISVINQLDRERVRLSKIHKASLQEQVLTYAEANAIVASLSTTYMTGRAIYENYVITNNHSTGSTYVIT